MLAKIVRFAIYQNSVPTSCLQKKKTILLVYGRYLDVPREAVTDSTLTTQEPQNNLFSNLFLEDTPLLLHYFEIIQWDKPLVDCFWKKFRASLGLTLMQLSSVIILEPTSPPLALKKKPWLSPV